MFSWTLIIFLGCVTNLKLEDICIDGVTDDLAVVWYADDDDDGYGDADNSTAACDQPEGYVVDDTDCDDLDAAVNPDADDICNEIDDDCDYSVDEGIFLETWYPDADGDGHGLDDSPSLACGQPEGYTADGTDCDDGDAMVYPSATEDCDGQDNNCDGVIDEGIWPDEDGDHVPACTDCDETDAAVGGPTNWYVDADGDGYVLLIDGVESCTQPDGLLSETEHDCSDTNPAIHDTVKFWVCEKLFSWLMSARLKHFN